MTTAIASDRDAVHVLPVGAEVAGFEVVGVLGRGSFGTVYLARQGSLADRPVVLKVSPSLQAESRMLAQLQHTNIVPIYSIHRLRSFQVVCMPFLGTTTLRDVLNDLRNHASMPETGLGLISSLIEARTTGHESGTETGGRSTRDVDESPDVPDRGTDADRPLPRTLKYLEGLTYVQAVLWIGARLASGLAHAHERGILHLDLKPANILLTREGQPMLLDFNLSLDLKARQRGGGIGGTVIYMSPEQLEAYRGMPGPIDARSDLYSLGIILYELLTGRRPFADVTTATSGMVDRLIASREDAPRELRDWNREVSPAVESIVRHCLEADPARRYQNASQLQEDLERQLTHHALRFAPEPSLKERAGKWLRRHPAVSSTTAISAASFLAIVLLGSVAWWAMREARRSQARLSFLTFHENFEVCQLLLNTVHLGSNDHLRGGVAMAQHTIDPFVHPDRTGWEEVSALPDLSDEEEAAFRGELAELIMLEVRARLAMLDPDVSAEARREELESLLRRIELADRVDPTLPAAFHYDRSRLNSLLGREQAAIEDRLEFEAAPLRTARDFYLAGTALLVQGRVDRAESALGRAVALAPRQFWTWFALGICHADQGRHAEAAGDFACSSIAAPHLAWPYLNRGLSLAKCGRLMEAVECYDRALEITPSFVEALVDRGLAYLDLGHPQSALKDLDRASSLASPTAEIRAARAEALSRVRDHAAAEAEFAEILRESPDNPLVIVARGFSRLGEDDAGARADFARALQLDPKNARAHLGKAHLVRGKDARAALAEVDQALELDPALADALQLRALTRARLNDPRAESDVDLLLAVPTPQRLYNAACTLSLLNAHKADPRRCSRALDLLARALDAGIQPGYALSDPDLRSIRKHPRFDSLIGTRRRRGGGSD